MECALAPLFMVMLHDLAIGRGLLAAWLFRVIESESPFLHLIVVLVACRVISLLSTFYFEQPVSRAMRRRFLR